MAKKAKKVSMPVSDEPITPVPLAPDGNNAPAQAPEPQEAPSEPIEPAIAPENKPFDAAQGKPDSGIFSNDGELVVDVFETHSDFVVSTAIAGVQIKDIDISVEKDMMIIKGQRQDPHEHHDKKYFFQECYWGPFSRKIVLPENIDTENAQASMEKGVLTVKIPKLAKEKKEVKLS